MVSVVVPQDSLLRQETAGSREFVEAWRRAYDRYGSDLLCLYDLDTDEYAFGPRAEMLDSEEGKVYIDELRKEDAESATIVQRPANDYAPLEKSESAVWILAQKRDGTGSLERVVFETHWVSSEVPPGMDRSAFYIPEEKLKSVEFASAFSEAAGKFSTTDLVCLYDLVALDYVFVPRSALQEGELKEFIDAIEREGADVRGLLSTPAALFDPPVSLNECAAWVIARGEFEDQIRGGVTRAIFLRLPTTSRNIGQA